MEAPVGFEPTIRVLQTRALPLGYGAAHPEISRMPGNYTTERSFMIPVAIKSTFPNPHTNVTLSRS